jgi:hypothetical protein
MLKVIVTIQIKNQAYEGGVEDADILEEIGFAASTGSFKGYSRDGIDHLVYGAIKGATKNLAKKLDAIKGKSTSK